MKQPKILFVIDNLSTGGAQRQLVNLAVGLTQRGYKVEIFCYTPGNLLAKPLHDANITVHWHLKQSRYSLDVLFHLRRLLLSGNFDLILSFLSTPNFYSIVATHLVVGKRVPVIVSERSCDLPQGISRTERFVRWFYKFADHIVINSNHQRENFSQRYPGLRKHLSTIYNGYDLNIHFPPLREPHNSQLQMLVIASVSQYKNGLCLIEALNILQTKYNLHPSVTWIGQRVMKGERLAYLREMEQKIQKYRFSERWQWLDQRTDIIQQLHMHDVLIHPSYIEGLPNVVCEALACGRPVIVSDVLDHPRLVQDRQSGYLFNWKSPSNLAEKIQQFHQLSLDERWTMGQHGRRYAESNLSLERFLDEYENLIQCLL